MTRSYRTLRVALMGAAALALLAQAPAAAAQGCAEARRLQSQGLSRDQIASVLGAPLQAVHNCFMPQRQGRRRPCPVGGRGPGAPRGRGSGADGCRGADEQVAALSRHRQSSSNRRRGGQRTVSCAVSPLWGAC